MKNIFGVGTGPGGSEYLTLQAVRTIQSADIIFAPDNEGRHIAFDTAAEFVKNKKIIMLNFPMGKVKNEHYKKTAELIVNEVPDNGSGVFLTMGDPLIYSTFINLMAHLKKLETNIQIISGIPSFVAAAGKAQIPLIKKGETLAVTDKLSNDIFTIGDSIVLLKTFKEKQKIISEFEKNNFVFTYIKRVSLQDEMILTNRDKEKILNDEDYLSLIIADKR